ncbi:hypothetical protein JM79_2204 [Gramella sp. Hel_I_59]|jgi:KaiC/GvpD/RAD55 family RecA-like ATPase|uniref:hypothetical protein n=1 Tax=Gramella sp. Hel_I_59 TaxID=1249978 RepID=UPI0011513473|nr:hypothetical protein [Gramella sp. Hel_I_59]TQI71276.1 hypothetical protein JM79_2204 [Gramella sp. Hel_I_59]
MNENLLPHYSKKFALGIGIITLIALIFKNSYVDLLLIDQTRLVWILKNIILIALIVLVFSKEKNVTKNIEKLKLQELKGALGFGIIILFFDSFQELVFWDGDYEMKSGYELMVAMLIFHLVFFYYRKSKLKNTSKR